MSSIKDVLRKPIFICGAPRSGTTLLCDLLDGHSNLMSYPFEFDFLECYHKYLKKGKGYFINGFLQRVNQKVCCDEEFFNWYNKYLEDTFGESLRVDLGDYHFDEFRRIFSELLGEDLSLNNIISSYYESIYQCSSSIWSNFDLKYFVDKRPLYNEIYAQELLKVYPNAKFVHIIRNPKSRYSSIKAGSKINNVFVKHFNKILEKVLKTDNFVFGDENKYVSYENNIDFVSYFCFQSLFSMNIAKENQRVIGGERYKVIKFEELIDERNKIVDELIIFLGIEKEKILYQQTQGSKRKETNSSFVNEKNNINLMNKGKVIEEKFTKLTSESERRLFNYYLYDISKSFGYEINKINKELVMESINEPFKYERICDRLIGRKKTRDLIENHKNVLFEDIIF